MELSPIGRVRSVRGETSEIEVFPEYLDGLYRVEEHERLMVLFLFDRSSAVKLRVNPRGDLRNPLVGVFSSRSPDRPNHIGVTTVKLLGVSGGVLTVEGLDAWEGTPIIDIKPDRRRNGLELDGPMVKTN
jgi:tRNA (adenine37-N6)-methyltransferase